MKSYNDAVELAVQVAYEYPSFTCEHLYEFINTYGACGSGEEAPCDIDELGDLANIVAKLRLEGFKYSEAIFHLQEIGE